MHMKFFHIFLLFVSLPLYGVDFVVNETLDAVDINPGDGVCATATAGCSVRAAVMEANALPGADAVLLPPGVFTLGIAGIMEEAALTGDLDVTESLRIEGAGSALTRLDGAMLDRLLDLQGPSPVTLTLNGVTLSNGLINIGTWFQRSGGALSVRSGDAVLANDVHFDGNEALHGGAVLLQGAFTGDRVQFTGNAAFGSGGGVFMEGGGTRLHLTQCLFSENTAASAAAMSLSGTDEDRGEASLDRCAVINNNSGNTGTLLNNSRVDTTVSNSTFSGNVTDGALFNDGGAVLFIRNSSIFNNQGTGIAEVHFNDQFIFIRNSLVAGNKGSIGVNCSLRLTSEGGNYFGDLDGCQPTLHASDVLGTDAPGVAPLTAMGQPWQWVHRPLSGSVLQDGGLDSVCEAHDQLDQIRPQDDDLDGQAHCSIGAVEGIDVIFRNGWDVAVRQAVH